ncbi:hypothetical protein B0293_28640 [Amycolatopsis azurea DSM 43854]|uniref:Uncharacterized protein n=1 Tax=Amycolatopsis azurea DSM 43854 TaxID=1238180 RepID=A0ABX3J5I9_9PSEU|nr:hypothetical protein B0293_28640 [Amycolatopsis azurea DSM 43854]
MTDNIGKINSTRRLVKAGVLPPTAAFTGHCGDDVCTFDANASSNEEGAITGYARDVGDGATGTGRMACRS